MCHATPSADERARTTRDTLRLEALGLMTAGIVHDLGNMVQILSSAIGILGRHPQIRATDALQPVIAGAVDSIDRAGGMVRQILGFVREDLPAEQDLDVALLLAGMEPLLRWACPRTARLELALDGAPMRVRCNRQKLENALLNLVINARDAMPSGGTITVFARHYGERAGGVEIGVSDTGTGMSDAVIARAFEPLFTTKPHGQGTGLGLPMVRRFAQETGGNAWIDSQVGRGTTVTLRLPVQAPG